MGGFFVSDIEAVEWGAWTVIFDRRWILFIANDWRLEFALPYKPTPEERKIAVEMMNAMGEGESYTAELALRVFRMIEKYLMQKRRREEGYEA